MSYYEHPAYVPWLRRSLDGWREIESGSGSRLLELTGALYMGREDSELITGCRRAIEHHALPCTPMSRRELVSRYPAFKVPDDYVGLLDHDAGYIRCEEAIRGMLRAAGRSASGSGSLLTLRPNEAVTSWRADRSVVQVTTDAGAYESRRLIVTSGAWAGSLLSGLDLSLAVTRQVQGWLAARDDSLTHLPCWAIDPGDGSLFYGFPALPGPSGTYELKCARHARGQPTTPDTIARRTVGTDADDFMPLVRRFLPALSAAPVRSSTCMYTNSPDSLYLLDRHPLYAIV
jgi:sarcosine oxidase